MKQQFDSCHISNVLGKLILQWEKVNPVALKSIKKHNDANNNYLLMDSEDKLNHIRLAKLKQFKCSNGKVLNLFDLRGEAHHEKPI